MFDYHILYKDFTKPIDWNVLFINIFGQKCSIIIPEILFDFIFLIKKSIDLYYILS